MKLDVLKLNFRILRLYGLMYNPNSRLCRTVSLCFIFLSVLNLLSHVVELGPAWHSPTIYAAPLKIANSQVFAERAGYLTMQLFIAQLPNIAVYILMCSLIMQLTTLFSALVQDFQSVTDEVRGTILLQKYPTLFIAKTWWISVKWTCMRRP